MRAFRTAPWKTSLAGIVRSPSKRRPRLILRLDLVLVPGGVGVLLAEPVVALLLEAIDQFGAAALDDPAAEEEVDELGLDVVEDALVVGDDQDAGPLRLGDPVDPLADDPHGIDVQAAVGLVEDG